MSKNFIILLLVLAIFIAMIRVTYIQQVKLIQERCTSLISLKRPTPSYIKPGFARTRTRELRKLYKEIR